MKKVYRVLAWLALILGAVVIFEAATAPYSPGITIYRFVGAILTFLMVIYAWIFWGWSKENKEKGDAPAKSKK